jgi:hypothetical protein
MPYETLKNSMHEALRARTFNPIAPVFGTSL